MTLPQLPPRPAARTAVWLVEPDPARANLAREQLSSHHDVVILDPGHDILARLTRGARPDVLLLAGGLPALELCRRLRARFDGPSLPILVITPPADVSAALEAGATDTLSPPYDAGALWARLRVLVELRRAGAARDHLRREGNLRRAICAASADAIVLIDEDGRYVEANPAACVLYGRSRENLVGRALGDFTSADLRSALLAAWKSLHAQKQWTHVYRLVRPDGTARDVETHTTADAHPGLHLMLLRDVTERLRREEAHAQLGVEEQASERA